MNKQKREGRKKTIEFDWWQGGLKESTKLL